MSHDPAVARHRLWSALGLGLAASLFFAVTFVLNRRMDLGGGAWQWSAALRYFFMLPMLALLLAPGGGLGRAVGELRRAPLDWLLWSTVGFGLFYAPLCLAASLGPAWMVAASWQLTIVAGALLTPFLSRMTGSGRRGLLQRLPMRQLAFSSLILAGVAILLLPGRAAGGQPGLLALLVIIAAFSYPLGNRVTMRLAGGRLAVPERLFAMTLASTPLWIAVAVWGLLVAGPPSAGQVLQTSVVALSSGLVATLLFFKATTLVRDDMPSLAAVESTQAGEVLFALAGGIALFGDAAPGPLGIIGLALVIVGMLMNGLAIAAPKFR